MEEAAARARRVRPVPLLDTARAAHESCGTSPFSTLYPFTLSPRARAYDEVDRGGFRPRPTVEEEG